MASRRILEPGVSPPAQEQFHGESLKSLSVPGFVLSECRYPPNFETPMHAHERALFCLAVEGAYTARYGPKTCTCEPSSPLFHAPNEMHSVHFQNSGGRFFIIEIEPWWLERVREQGAVIDFSSDFKGGSLAMFGMNLYQEFLAMDGVSPLIVEGLMLAIIGKPAPEIIRPRETPRRFSSGSQSCCPSASSLDSGRELAWFASTRARLTRS
jgi:AraC-like ligand binding domain